MPVTVAFPLLRKIPDTKEYLDTIPSGQES